MTEVKKCIVLFPFKAQRKDELTLKEGDILVSVCKREDGWWHGCIEGRTGVFPANHVRILSDDDSIEMSTGPKFVVTYSYNPVKKDELELVVGEIVEKLGDLEPGWWTGISRGSFGVFPSSFVTGPVPEPAVETVGGHLASLQQTNSYHVTSPDFDNTRSLRLKSAVTASVGSSTALFNPRPRPLSANLFDPEDEPIGPLFGSISSQLNENWSTASLNSCSNKKPGLFDRIRHSFSSGKSILPKFMSRRLSSGSLFETRSANSPVMSRRNSFAAFFKRSSMSISDSKQDVTVAAIRDRNSVSSFKSIAGHLPEQSTPVANLQGDFRKVSLSSDIKIKRTGTCDPEQSLSWVFQEVGSKNDIEKSERRPRISSGDSGVDECESKEHEEYFGPTDITDEIFEDMFSPSKKSRPVSNVHAGETIYENVFNFSEVEADFVESITEL